MECCKGTANTVWVGWFEDQGSQAAGLAVKVSVKGLFSCQIVGPVGHESSKAGGEVVFDSPNDVVKRDPLFLPEEGFGYRGGVELGVFHRALVFHRACAAACRGLSVLGSPQW